MYVGIDVPLEKRNVQVEHFMSKARHPELRFEMSNLVASCRTHNRMKGSLDGPEFLKILDENRSKNG